MDKEKEIIWTEDMGFMPPVVKIEGRTICRGECQLTEYKQEIEQLREALDKYDCSCTEPCALYKMEKKRESEMPHMVCGWWASAALKEGE